MKPPRTGRCGSCGRAGLLVWEEVWPDGPDDGMAVWVCHQCRTDDGEDAWLDMRGL